MFSRRSLLAGARHKQWDNGFRDKRNHMLQSQNRMLYWHNYMQSYLSAKISTIASNSSSRAPVKKQKTVTALKLSCKWNNRKIKTDFAEISWEKQIQILDKPAVAQDVIPSVDMIYIITNEEPSESERRRKNKKHSAYIRKYIISFHFIPFHSKRSSSPNKRAETNAQNNRCFNLNLFYLTVKQVDLKLNKYKRRKNDQPLNHRTV